MEPQTTSEAAAPVAPTPTSAPISAPAAVVDQVGGAPLATAGQRFAAYLLEGVLVLATLIVGYLVWMVILWGEGQTPGKKLMGLRVVKYDTGKAATRGTMALRELIGKPVCQALFGIPFIISIIGILGVTRRALWDKIAGTVVVVDKEGITV